mmetsp:Transcript_43763/g.102989  ORF Transcript_43763/g.102989 Transcript_43763/m.102989 type:complete len:314 (+) Transcript_43763:89-1030(+)
MLHRLVFLSFTVFVINLCPQRVDAASVLQGFVPQATPRNVLTFKGGSSTFLKSRPLAAKAPRRCRIVTSMREGLQAWEQLLSDFDKRQQEYAKENGEGFGGGTSAVKFAEEFEDRKGLQEAVEKLTAEAETVMLGICAESAEAGVHALKEWVSALNLPRGKLHGMDEEGVPIDMSNFGAVYIKYMSQGGQVFEPGDANLNGYDGSYRGVYFNPVLADGEFRQYAVLPLDLFHGEDTGVPHVLKRVGLTVGEVQELLVPVQATVENLGGFVAVVSVDADTGVVELNYNGPLALTYGIRDQLLASPHIKEVLFVN